MGYLAQHRSFSGSFLTKQNGMQSPVRGLHPVFSYTKHIYYTTSVNAISIHNMNKYSILALAHLRMDAPGPV